MHSSRIYKTILSFSLMATISTSLSANLVYDPAADILYSSPTSPEINRAEYLGLLIACVKISNNMNSHNNGMRLPKKEVLGQFTYYLKKINTPTALRLLADLEKDKVFYPDGSFMDTIFA